MPCLKSSRPNGWSIPPVEVEDEAPLEVAARLGRHPVGSAAAHVSCAGDAMPMHELVVRLELPPATNEAGGATGV
jgi:hypothetical protein